MGHKSDASALTGSVGSSSVSTGPAGLASLHSVLVLITVLWRPLISVPDHLGLDHFLWHVCVALGWALLTIEYLQGWRRSWYWGWSGVIAGLLILSLWPAWWRAYDPAAGWGFGLSMSGQLLFAAYLCQVAAGRRSLILASLCASLLIQAVLGLAQAHWVLPFLRQSLNDEGLQWGELAQHQGDLQERLQQGGVYATYTLSNALAVVQVALVLLAVAWAKALPPRLDYPRLIFLLIIFGLGLTTLYHTGSKGGWLTMVLLLLLAPLSLFSPRWRYLSIGILAGALLALLLVGPLLAMPSVQVRLGYWQAAWVLWQQAPLFGHGWESYAWLSAEHLPLWAEYSRRAHNEIIEVLVAGGIWPALALLAWMLSLLIPTSPGQEGEKASEEPLVQQPAWLPWLAIPCLCYVVLLGSLHSDNLVFWPGGGSLPGLLLWAFVLGTMAAVLIRYALLLPLPRAADLRLVLAALLIGCLIDFHLHSASFVALILTLACLMPPRSWTPPIAPRQIGRICALAMLVLLAVLLFAQRRVQGLRLAENLDQALSQALQGDQTEHDWALLAEVVSLAEGSYNRLDAKALSERAQALIIRYAGAWPASERLLRRAHMRLPHAQERYRALREHADRFAENPSILGAMARAQAEQGKWNQAIDYQQQAIRRNPWLLPLRQQLIRYYHQAARVHAADRSHFEALISAEEARIEKLRPQVFGRNRPR